MEKQKTIDVINELLVYLKLNPKQLSDALGYNRPSWIYEVLNPNKSNGISKRVGNAICEKWPELDFNYLMTGEGSLIKKEYGPVSVGGDQNGNINSPGATTSPASLDSIIGVVGTQAKQISSLIQQNQDLINIISNLSKINNQ